ncbi:hypothetical protein [uncultured Clostridium sp.]|nr:hypothetical protein [uncultured Clostridium sp.]
MKIFTYSFQEPFSFCTSIKLILCRGECVIMNRLKKSVMTSWKDYKYSIE